MPNLIKQGEARVVTKNGEVFVNIALELTIKLDGTNIGLAATATEQGAKKTAENQEKVNWEIPDFTSEKIQFGK
jgi:hypothetical protein